MKIYNFSVDKKYKYKLKKISTANNTRIIIIIIIAQKKKNHLNKYKINWDTGK